MGTKMKMNGKGMAMFSNTELLALSETKGKKGNKARVELAKRKITA